MNAGTARRILFALCLPLAGIAANAQSASPAAPPLTKPAAVSPKVIANYGKLPLSFEPNRGQTAKEVQWLARGPEYTLFLAGNDAVLEMNKITPAKRGATSPKELAPSISSSVVRMSLLGARTSQRTTGEDLQSGKANYFTGNDPAKWQHDVPMYGKVRMQGVYPGIDLVYYGHQGALEYDFVVAPGADASVIKLRFDDAKPIVASNGDLVLPVEGGPELRFNKPVIYQMVNGVRQPVDGSFAIASANRQQQVSFHLGAYDHSRELVIDPTLLFVGVLGTGNYETQAIGMAVDASGEIILTGETSDVNFPVTTSAYQTTCNQDSAVAAANNYVRCGGASEGYLGSAFITKISADGTSLVYSTYLHGLSGSEIGQAVAVDTAGDAIILGQTGSSDFPITANAIQSLCMPYYYPIGVVGGSPSDFYQPAAQHCDGYFSGGGTEWVSGGPTLFIAKLDPTGATLLYSTFFGGTYAAIPNALALDSSGNIYFTSFMQGNEEYLSGGLPVSNVYPQNGTVPFPVTAGAFQTTNLAQQVTTLSELSADGQTLLYSTLFGATNVPNAGSPLWIQPLSLAVGPNGIAYVGGMTYSDSVPTTPGAVRPACVDSTVYNGGNETGNCEGQTGWLAAFDTTKSGAASLKYATYIGGPEAPVGNPQAQVWGLAADSENNVYVTGLTNSPNYPTTPGAYSSICTNYRAAYGCNNTAFLTKIDPTGSTYVWSTYFGGNNDSSSQGQAIALDAKGQVYLYGYDSNYTYDLPFVNPLEPRPGNGSSYAFVATFSPDGTQLLFSTPLGNQSPSAANVYPVQNNGIALDAAGNIYFAAYGGDGGTFIPTTGTYATTAAGTWNRTYFGKISPVLALDTTTLTIAPATTTTGQDVTFTATVAGTTLTTPSPTGTVTLTDGNTTPATVLGAITLNNGTGAYSTSSLTARTYSVTASYSGDSVYDLSTSSAQTLTISNLNSTSTALTVSPSGALTYGQSVTLTATVTQGGGVATGTVIFNLGGVTLGSGTLNGSGVATYTTVLPAGSGTLTAAYGGSATDSASTSSNVSVTIAAAPLTVTAANASRMVGAANPTFTGTVTGTVNNDVLVASYSTTATAASPAGTYPIVPAVTGTNIANYSVTLVNGTLTVTAPTATTTVLTSSATSVSPGTSVTFTATVTGTAGKPTPTGNVTFTDGATTLGSNALNGSGIATYATTTLAVGTHSIVANYGGDPSNAASASNAITVSVVVANPVPTISGISPSILSAGSAGFTISVTGSGFASGAAVQWGGSARTTTLVDGSHLTASITAADIATVGTANVTVVNPAPGGGTSSAFAFSIDSAANAPGLFTVTAPVSTLTVLRGQNTVVTLTFGSLKSGATISAACLNLPSGATCTFDNTSQALTVAATTLTSPGQYPIIAQFKITEQSAALAHPRVFVATWLGFSGLPIIGLLWMGRRQNKVRLLILMLGLFMALALAGCGSSTATPSTTNAQVSLPFTLTVN
ncbi:MAG: Ig-like domain repeat protein [Candidatus Korobacteraceae bacterium]|jgi:hypothetical protein